MDVIWKMTVAWDRLSWSGCDSTSGGRSGGVSALHMGCETLTRGIGVFHVSWIQASEYSDVRREGSCSKGDCMLVESHSVGLSEGWDRVTTRSL